MSQYHRNHPDEPVSHDWTKPGVTKSITLSSIRKSKKPKRSSHVVSLAPCDCNDDDDCIKIGRTCKTIGNWWMLTDGFRVTLCHQKPGEKPTESVTIDPALFRKFIAWFQKPQKVTRG